MSVSLSFFLKNNLGIELLELQYEYVHKITSHDLSSCDCSPFFKAINMIDPMNL